jgi:hypothetical protein
MVKYVTVLSIWSMNVAELFAMRVASVMVVGIKPFSSKIIVVH